MSARVLVITAMRNEGPFVLEWVAHHLALGVDEIIVISNDCDDGTDHLLEALAKTGRVTHVAGRSGGQSVQWRALRTARAHASYARADWVTCIDCDEFICLKPPHDTLQDLIAASDPADAILLPWRLFGSGGQLQFDASPTTERFQQAAPERMVFPAAARFFKTLYRRSAFAGPGVHRPRPRKAGKSAIWVDGSGDPLPGTFVEDHTQILSSEPQSPCANVQLNHYSLRSAEDFMVKRRRGLPNRASKPLDATYWAERNFNTVEDTAINRFGTARASVFEDLLTDASVRKVHQACIDAHRRAIAEILRNPDEARLYTRLALLSDSAVPDDQTARMLLRIIQQTMQAP